MGTYGVTHVKKNDKIIPLSDSYDGYFSNGMGQANLFTIKHMSDNLLDRLFDRFTAHLTEQDDDDDYDEKTLTNREIEEVIFNFSKEGVTQEAQDWLKIALSDSIRTSLTGVGPLLYLNYHPHYGRDYEYCDYLVDLDNKKYYIQDYPVDFDLIRQLSVNKINFLGTYLEKAELKEFGLKNHFPELINEYSSLSYDEKSQKKNQKKLIEIDKKIKCFLTDLLKLDENLILNFYQKKEEERRAYLAQYKENNKRAQSLSLIEETEDSGFGSYSVRTANNISSAQLRKVLVFCNKLGELAPEAQLLLKNAMWGMQENYQHGGISFFSPRGNKKVEQNCYEATMEILENEFKMRFNIMSTAGSNWKYAHEVTETEAQVDDEWGLLKTAIIEKCCYSLDEIKKENPEIVQNLDIWLVYHGNYQEIRKEILEKQDAGYYAIVWVYMALLNQDKDLFDIAYETAKKQYEQCEDKVKEIISKNYLISLSDGQHIEKLVTNLAHISNVEKNDGTEAFVQHLKNKKFLNELEPYMNNSEKGKYLKKTKVKP